MGSPDPARRAEGPGRGRLANNRGTTYYARSHAADWTEHDANLIFSDLFRDWSNLRGTPRLNG